MTQPIESICVIGAGYMGNQIALQCAAYGFRVRMHDASEESLELSHVALSGFLDRMIADGFAASDQRQREARNPIRADARKRSVVAPKRSDQNGQKSVREILDRIQRTTALAEAVTDVDLVIEAISEDVSVKRDVFRQLDKLCPHDVIFATNSSSIRISRIESATERPDRLLNAHFVQPIWKHPFVELMRGSSTSDVTLNAVNSFMESIGVLPVLVRKESTGFIFNRIWRAVKKEALKVVDQGIATVEDVDRTWMIQMETPMGPLGTMDIIGLDVVRDIEMVYYEESGDPTDAPPGVLLDKIANGELGVKTGKGFYTYPDPSWQSPDFLKVASP